MSYTGSQAQSGFKSKMQINTGTISTPTWVDVDEVVGLTQSGTKNKTDDTTNLQSTAEEFIPTILTPGSWQFDMNRLPSTTTPAGQAALLASFNAATIKQYRVALPLAGSQTTLGDNYTFLALVEELPLTDVKVDKKIKYTCTLKISGAIAFAAGT